jgi:hypothetical protein
MKPQIHWTTRATASVKAILFWRALKLVPTIAVMFHGNRSAWLELRCLMGPFSSEDASKEKGQPKNSTSKNVVVQASNLQ